MNPVHTTRADEGAVNWESAVALSTGLPTLPVSHSPPLLTSQVGGEFKKKSRLFNVKCKFNGKLLIYIFILHVYIFLKGFISQGLAFYKQSLSKDVRNNYLISYQYFFSQIWKMYYLFFACSGFLRQQTGGR